MYPLLSVITDRPKVRTVLSAIGEPPSQIDIDAAYSVKVFLDYHPCRQRSIAVLALQSELHEARLRKAFLYAFNETLDNYWERAQWKPLSQSQN